MKLVERIIGDAVRDLAHIDKQRQLERPLGIEDLGGEDLGPQLRIEALDIVVGEPGRSVAALRAAIDKEIAGFAAFDRSIRKPARTSSEKSFGCSLAAKWPPLSTLL